MNTQDYEIAVIEDDEAQLDTLCSALKAQGFKTACFTSRQEAEAHFASHLPDLVVSDIILGQEVDGGFDLARTLLNYDRPIPIIFLSERQSEFDIHTGHALGAIDYLPKPISLTVLSAKIKNLLRFTHQSDSQGSGKIPHLRFADKQLKAYWHDQPLDLTATEYEMLKQFDEGGPETVVTYQKLQESTQGVVERNTLNTHICRIRNAFKKITPDFNHIHNAYGKGYFWKDKS
jgi:two-component system OmpR family response regulator